ncbi:MAG: helix-turn-helix domain-containing protein, partial [Nitrososphaerales archaeon]
MNETQESPPSLVEEHRQLTRWRIRRAAMEAVARRGFDATVEEIAQMSGVSARTIFRHYASHDQLVLATVKDMFAACGRRPIEGLPSPDADLDGWIEGFMVTIHTPSRTTSAVLGEIGPLRRHARTRGAHLVASLAWHKAGGVGEPLPDLVSAFA